MRMPGRSIRSVPSLALWVGVGLAALAIPATDSVLSAQEEANSDAVSERAVKPDQDPGKVEKEVVGWVSVSTDAPCHLWINGVQYETLEPGVEFREPVPLEAIKVRAVSADAPGAVWTKTVTIETGDELSLRIKMARAIRLLRKDERKNKVQADWDEGLMWARVDNGESIRWQKAIEYCDGSKLGGWENWRLPSLSELESLQSKWTPRGYKIQPYVKLSACCPWSASEVDEGTAWNYDFRYRRAFAGSKQLSFDHRALCLRPITPAETAEREQQVAERKRQKKEANSEPTDPAPEDPPE